MNKKMKAILIVGSIMISMVIGAKFSDAINSASTAATVAIAPSLAKDAYKKGYEDGKAAESAKPFWKKIF